MQGTLDSNSAMSYLADLIKAGAVVDFSTVDTEARNRIAQLLLDGVVPPPVPWARLMDRRDDAIANGVEHYFAPPPRRSQAAGIKLFLAALSGDNAFIEGAQGRCGTEDIAQQLDAIVVSRLFGKRPWLVDEESSAALDKLLHGMKVIEVYSATSSRNTLLGIKLNIDLIMVFLGMWDPWEIPGILEIHSLIDEHVADELLHRLEKGRDPERALKPRVKQAYLDYFNPAGRRH